MIFDHAADYAAALDRLAPMVADGSLVHDEDIAIGIDAAQGAIARLYEGQNEGKSLIFIG